MNHELSETARNLIRDIAAQHPALQNYLTGFFEGKGEPHGQGTLVIDAAHIETSEPEAPDAVR